MPRPTARQTKGRGAALAALLRAAGDESRLRIIRAVLGQPRICVSEVAERLGVSIAIASHHLKALAAAGLLSPVRNGKRVCFVFNDRAPVRDLMRIVRRYS